MSQETHQALKEVVRWHPYGANYLLSILREFPKWVMYKNDEFGPIGLIFAKPLPSLLEIELGKGKIPTSPFPKDKLPGCRKFGQDGRQENLQKKSLRNQLKKS